MNYTAEISPSGERFDVAPDETVLDAALRAGIALEYGCRHGNCSSCKYLLADGEVEHGQSSIYSLSEDEREDGYALMCCARPTSDLVIEARLTPDPRALPLSVPQAFAAELSAIERLTPALWKLRLELDSPLAFHAGQFAELTPPWADIRRSYSIASAPSAPRALEFIIKHVPDGAFAGRLPAARVGARFTVRGPFGTSYLRDGGSEVLLCATGSGIAPILAMLGQAASQGDARRYRLFYGARTLADLPVLESIEQCREALGERFAYLPCLSRAPADWQGRSGRVTQALQREAGSLDDTDAYLCGAAEMCDAVGTLLEAKGLRAGRLFFDRFHAAA